MTGDIDVLVNTELPDDSGFVTCSSIYNEGRQGRGNEDYSIVAAVNVAGSPRLTKENSLRLVASSSKKVHFFTIINYGKPGKARLPVEEIFSQYNKTVTFIKDVKQHDKTVTSINSVKCTHSHGGSAWPLVASIYKINH